MELWRSPDAPCRVRGWIFIQGRLRPWPSNGLHFSDAICTERDTGILPTNEKYCIDSSPRQNATGLKSNLLVAYGTGDDHVHFSNSLLLIDQQICEGN
jgi:hypothetical protein